jgi:hypothetical protein
MRNLILGVLLLPALAYAQPVTVEKPVICDTPKIVIETLTSKQYQEQPFWIGADKNSRYVMLVNEKTSTWSFVQLNENIACVLGTGEHYRQIFSKPTV